MNLFKKTTATVALVALVSGIFSTGVSANSTSQIEAANALAAAGYINNHADDTAAYNLNQNVLRQEIAAVARGIAGLEKKSTCDNEFEDVTATTPNTWACYTVEALADADLIAKNPKFNPEKEITKAEAVAMMVKATFPDYAYDATKGTSWQEQVVAFAVEKGVSPDFTDYNTSATRGFVFEAGNNAMVASTEVADECDEVSQLLGLCGETTTEETTTENVLTVELSPETPNITAVANNKDRTELVAFDVTAGSEDVTLKDLTVKYVGLSDSADITKIAAYLGNEKVTKGTTRKFDSDNEVELNFENDTVVKAGETLTFFITANVTSTGVVSHKVEVKALTASTEVELGTIVSNSFGVIDASNSAAVELDINDVTLSTNVGDVEDLADFSLEEKTDKEDAIVKSMTFQFTNVDAEDDVSNLALYADGVMIADNLSANSDDEVIVDLDFTIPSDEKVDFILKGSINDIKDDITLKLTDLFIKGSETGIISNIYTNYSASPKVSYNSNSFVATDIDVKGSEINVSFDKSDIDEAKPNSDEVAIGTLKLTSVSDYTIDRLVVKAESSSTGAKSIVNVIKRVELNGTSEDYVMSGKTDTTDTANSGTTDVYYAFDDISLNNETKEFNITFDINDDVTFNGESITFTTEIVKVTDEDDNNTAVLADVLSTNSLDSKTIDIKSANATLTQTKMTANDLVIGNGVEVVLYKGKLNVGDADDIKIKKMTFTGALSNNAYDYKDILDTVTLNIGGKTFDADINATNVKFNSMNAVVAAGSNNVEVTLTARLKDSDDVEQGDTLVLDNITEFDVEDTDGETLALGTSAKVNPAADTTITLNEKGSIDFAIVNNGDNKDEISDVVLAGTNSVNLAEVELEANDEDIKVQELVFTMTGVDLSTTIKNVRLMNGSSVIADDAVVTYVEGEAGIVASGNFTGTVVTFDDDFIIEESTNKINALLVADLETITDEGGVVSAIAGSIAIDLTSVDAKGVNSNDDIYPNSETSEYLTTATATSDAVKVVPALVTVSIDNTLGSNDKEAKIRFTIDKGDNSLSDDAVKVIALTTEDTISASGMTVRNDDGTDLVTSSTGTSHNLTANWADTEIVSGDAFAIRVVADNEEVRISKYGITYSVDVNGDGSITSDEEFTIANDEIINLGEYDAN